MEMSEIVSSITRETKITIFKKIYKIRNIFFNAIYPVQHEIKIQKR